MSDDNERSGQACQCELCMAARAAPQGPKEPRDDDDDSDDDKDAALCDCAACRPQSIPVGDELVNALKSYCNAMVKNYDLAGDFGQSLTDGLGAKPMPEAVETIMLQYAVDNWNAADRALCALCQLIPQYDAAFDAELPTPKPKTLDEARGVLVRFRANRPRKKNHDPLERVRKAVERLLDSVGAKAGVSVKVLDLTVSKS